MLFRKYKFWFSLQHYGVAILENTDVAQVGRGGAQVGAGRERVGLHLNFKNQTNQLIAGELQDSCNSTQVRTGHVEDQRKESKRTSMTITPCLPSLCPVAVYKCIWINHTIG